MKKYIKAYIQSILNYLNIKNHIKLKYLKITLLSINLFSILALFINIAYFFLSKSFFFITINCLLIISTFMIECVLEYFIEDYFESFIIYRFLFFIFALLLITFFPVSINHFIEKLFSFSPRISLVFFSFWFNLITSIIVYTMCCYVILIFKIYNNKLFILKSINAILYIFIILGFFTTLYLKDKHFFISSVNPEEVSSISNDIFQGYTQIILFFFIYEFFIKNISKKINQIQNMKQDYQNQS